jgi:transposase-like protein
MLDLQWEVSRMPWQEVTRMESREEFVKLALQAGADRRELCRRFKIAPKTGYKWLLRYAEQGSGGLIDRSRQPRRSPQRTAAEIEQRVIEMRWRGARFVGRPQAGATAGYRGRPKAGAEHYHRHPAPWRSAQPGCAGAAPLSAL